MPMLLAFAAALALAVPAGMPPRDPSRLAPASLEQELARTRRDPAGLATLARLDELLADAPELARFATILASVADDGSAHPEVRALARFRLAGLERARGNLQKSAAHLRRLGFVGAWTVAGPFDDEGKRGFATAYPPERDVDLSAAMPGKARAVSWRALPPEAFSQGFVHLGAVMSPSREVVAYALTVVEAPRDERVQLWFGASGAAKVFVNGAVAIADPGYHPARLDQRAARISLRKGPNRILVKLCHAEGRMGFYLRFADEAGEGRSFAAGNASTPAPHPPLHAKRGEGLGEGPTPIRTAVAELERRVASYEAGREVRGAPRSAPRASVRRAAAEARLALALALDERRSADDGDGRAAAEARRAADLAPDWIEARLVAASLEEDRGRRRAQVEAALARAPDDAEALVALAQDELERDRPHAAARLLARAIRASPRWAAPRVALAEALDRAGLGARGALAAAEAAREFPTVPGAIRAAARAARRLGRDGEAAARLRTLLALRFDDRAARAELASILLDRGDVAGAAALRGEALRLDPWNVPERLGLADLLAANGRVEEAEAQFEAAVRIAPDDPEPYARRGRVRLALGRAVDAKADLERALDLRPQSPDLKELVRSLEPTREPFERPYLLDAAALARSSPAPQPGEDALILGDVEVTRVFPSGLSATVKQLVVKVANARGADAFRRRAISWDPDRQEIKVLRARIHRPDGTTLESHDESEQSTSEPWYRLYYDTRAKTLSFPALAPGDVLEVAWRIEDVATENLLSDYYGDMAFVEDDAARKLRFDRIVIVPEGRALYANAAPGVARTERHLPGRIVEHRFVATDVPRVVVEPSMPGWSEVARFVHVSTYATWDEVARFYWGLVREQLRPTDEVRRTARRIAEEALAGAPPSGARAVEPAALSQPASGWDLATKRLLVSAVYGFVVSQTRYVGLEFGIHGFKPYRVDDVLRRRFGDCKDKASLMHALLESLGIDSRLVLLRMRRLGRIPETPASLAVFNHAILWVPELDLWLDGTASWSGSRELPAEDRGATALVVNPDGPPRFVTLPDARPEDNRTESRFEITLAPDGRATVRGTSRIAGVLAADYRRAYLSTHDRRAQLEKAFSQTFPGLRVETVSLSDVTRIEEDVRMDFTLDVPRYAQADGAGLRFTPFGAADSYLETYASLSERRHPLVLGVPMENRFEYRFVLPAGWAAVDIPEDVRGEVPEASFEVRHRLEGTVLTVTGQVSFRSGTVAPDRYAAFRAVAAAIDRALSRRVRIAPAAPGATLSAASSPRGVPPGILAGGARSAPPGPPLAPAQPHPAAPALVNAGRAVGAPAPAGRPRAEGRP